MAGYFLGIDTGASKSEAIIVDEHGRILGFGHGGPGNWETVGWQGMRATLQATIGMAETGAGVSRSALTATACGLAGYDWPEDHAPHERALRELGVQSPLALYNDAFVGLPAGAPSGWGVVLSAGTSCNCYGRDASGRIGRMTGNSRYGEYAGAGELVQRALQGIARAWTHRGPQTRLSEVFVARTGATDVTDLLAGLVRGRYQVDAAQARIVFQVADEGDSVAAEAVSWAGRQLGSLALGVIRQLSLQDQAFDLVLAGSFFLGSDRLQALVEETVRREALGARIVRLVVPPVAGSALLALEMAGPVAEPVRATLLEGIGHRLSGSSA